MAGVTRTRYVRGALRESMGAKRLAVRAQPLVLFVLLWGLCNVGKAKDLIRAFHVRSREQEIELRGEMVVAAWERTWTRH